MSNVVKRGATAVLDAAMFAVGLVEGAVREVSGRIRGHRTAGGEPGRVPQPRENPRPEPPHRPTPDPYDVGVTTPVGTTGAAPAYNPSTAESDLQQPGTEEIMEPSTTKRIKSESEMMRKAAERNPRKD